MGKTNLVIKSRRALSPIFATLIILAVVTVLFVPVFIWATGMTSQNQESWQQSGIIATERIVIEEVGFNDTSATGTNVQNCTIYVRNIGETAVTINDVLITEPNGKIHSYQKLPIPQPAPPAPQYPSPVPLQLSTWKPGTATTLTSITKGNLIELRLPKINCIDNYRIQSGLTYTIQVFTTRGVGDTYQVVA